jgi:hypothetical protein
MASPPLSANCANTTLDNLIEAKQAAARLLGCYRTGDANDPETYVAAVIAVLSRYSAQIVREVTNPVAGLPAKLKWLPTIAEIRDECELLQARERRQEQRDADLRKQFAERKALEDIDRHSRKTYQQLVEECRARGIMIGPDGQSDIDVTDILRKKYGITDEQWDAIPNTPSK